MQLRIALYLRSRPFHTRTRPLRRKVTIFLTERITLERFYDARRHAQPLAPRGDQFLPEYSSGNLT